MRSNTTMTSRMLQPLLVAVLCQLLTKICGIAPDNSDITDDVIISTRCRARCLSRLQDRLATVGDQSLRSSSSSVSLSEQCQRDTPCLTCAMPCDVTAQHCDVICSSTPHVDEGCRESCEFLRQITDDWLAKSGTRVCPDSDDDDWVPSTPCTSYCDSNSDCLPDETCCSSEHCGSSCVRTVRQLTTGCGQELEMVMARELVDLDAVELTWKCLDEAESQPTIYLVQSMLTPGHRHATRRRRRRLRSTDAAVGTAAWRVVAQTSSCSAVVDDLRPTRRYYFRLFAVNASGCRGVSTASRPFVLSREPSKPYAPLNLTVGDTVIADGHVSVTLHWLPPMQSDLPVSRYKIFWSEKPVTQSDSVHEFRHVLPARHLSYRVDDLQLGTAYLIQIQSICQYGETRLKSEKVRMFITTPSSSVSADGDEEYAYDSSATSDAASLLPAASSTSAINSVTLHVDTPYFRNGLVRANVTWQTAANHRDKEDDGEEDDEDSGLYRLQWFLESCSDGRTSLGEVPLVAMSATTQDRHFVIYDLRFDCVYVVRLRDSADRVSGHVLVTTPTCEHVTVVGDVTPDCPPKAEHPPSAPRHLRYSFVITSVNITVQLGWQPPSAGDVTGYRVTCARAGPHWYTDRRTLITTVLSSNATSYSIGQLREATNYVVRVAATSAAGMGRHANARFTTPRLQLIHAHSSGQLPRQKDGDNAEPQHSDFNGRLSLYFQDNNHTEVSTDQNHGLENSMQHSSDVDTNVEDQTLPDNDPYYEVDGPTDWAEFEVRKLGRRKPQDESVTNEVHSYHIDLSTYYASSQTVSNSNLYITATTAFLLVWYIAH